MDTFTARAPRTTAEQHIIDAYKRVSKAVVNVSTRSDVFDFFGPVNQEGSGSGVIIDKKQGFILTNYHVIANAQRISVTLAGGQSLPVVLVGQDPDIDIALLEIVEAPEGLIDARLGNSTALEVGSACFSYWKSIWSRFNPDNGNYFKSWSDY